MFTGIVEEVGTVRGVHDAGGDLRLRIEAGEVLDGARIGDSIAVSGCCLTMVSVAPGSFEVELSKETVAKTAPRWSAGATVNLERAVRLGDRLGGHLVSGHVEGTGVVTATRSEPGANVVTVRGPEHMARFLIPKGSVTVDGVSLTVVDLGGPGGTRGDLGASEFTLWLIPHTLQVTTLGELHVGDRVNLEADLIAKHLERLAGFGPRDEQASWTPGPGATPPPEGAR